MKYCTLLIFLFIIGCDSPQHKLDQELRRELFKECLKLVPEGPKSTKYNDWAEVIDECGNEAYYQALVCIKNCVKKGK